MDVLCDVDDGHFYPICSEDESMMSAIIKIENVTKGDTTRIFFCTLTKNNDSTGFKISLMIQGQ